MNIKQIGCITAMLMLCVVSKAESASNTDGSGAAYRQVIEQNLAAYNREDIAGAMKFVHTKSPEYKTTQTALPSQFKTLDTRTKLVGFQFIGHDDEFAVARVKLKTVERSGKPFAVNILDTITIFHQEDGVWKYWSKHILGVEFVR